MIGTILGQMRVRQWTKNLALFAGVIFSFHFDQADQVMRATQGFLAFCLLASSVYTLNDLRDVGRDRLHPRKRNRPLPSGRISKGGAFALMLLLLAAAAVLSVPLGTGFLVTVGVYYVLNLLYSLVLKGVVLIDVMMIALGFVLRAVAGVEALEGNVEISPWLLMCTLFLALFLAVCKRRQERFLLAAHAEGHRATLAEYPPELIDQMVPVVTAATVISYSIYTVAPETVAHFNTTNLVFTIPFVVYGVFRYLYLVYRHQRGGSPSEVLLTDFPILFNILLWAAAVILVLLLRGS